MATVTVGTWHEKEARDIRQCPSYYAADWEVLRTKPGDYPVRVEFTGGYMVPMPYWILAHINADRIDGATYSGFAGNNFASTKLRAEPHPYFLQTYVYYMQELVTKGIVTLDTEWEWLAADHKAQIDGSRSLEFGKGLLALK